MEDVSDRYRDRQDEFGNRYEDFETSNLVDLVIAAGDFLERLTWERAAVDRAMKLLFEASSGYPAPQEMPWREVWREQASMELGVVNTSDYFVNLNAFAHFGLPLDLALFETPGDATDNSTREENWRRHINKGRELIDIAPRGWADIQEIERTVLAAEARLNLDFGRDVSIEQIAALARMTPKSIRNLLTPKSGETDLRVNQEGGIDASDALRWLNRRPDFKSSIWQDCEDRVQGASGPDERVLEEIVFVPVENNGSWFHPVECRNSRGYMIGPKGSEQPINDYFEALSLLTKMRAPKWRRPNSAGNWGLVTGVTWQRKEAAVLRELLMRGEE